MAAVRTDQPDEDGGRADDDADTPAWLGRLDHVNILLLIAGTYTPLMALALHGWTRLSVLTVVWAGAAGGIAAKLIWRPTWR